MSCGQSCPQFEVPRLWDLAGTRIHPGGGHRLGGGPLTPPPGWPRRSDRFQLQALGRWAVQANLAGIRPADEVAGTQHVRADVGPIHLRASALVVRDQGHQRLPQRGGVAAHVCGPTRGRGCSGWVGPPLLGARPWPPARTHSHPGGPSLLSGTCVPGGRSCQARADRWAGQTGSGRRSAPLSSPAGSGLGRREVGGQPATRGPVTAKGGHGVTWGAAHWAVGTVSWFPPKPHLNEVINSD